MANYSRQKITFVDAFAGCGGLSLGLFQAGLQGLFAIEKDKYAFETLSTNLLGKSSTYRYAWPEWLPKEPTLIDNLLTEHKQKLKSLKGSVDLLVGGPPCQGFSSAGRRKHNDPRNKLFKHYLELVNILKPRAVLIENVRGFTSDFDTGKRIINYASKLRNQLILNYDVYEELIDLKHFGVPQNRTRFFILAIQPTICNENPFDLIYERLPKYISSLGLKTPVASKKALSDLLISRNGRRPSTETTGFEEIKYKAPLTKYQKLMRGNGKRPTDLRIARHSNEITNRFKQIIKKSHAEGRLNTTISDEIKTMYGLKKKALRVLDPEQPSPTITSMPDDLIHYCEPRTLTVRENARLQTFPDWFEFKGKYTTGGYLRKQEVPRFTQVANAVPPLAARAFGELLKDILNNKYKSASKQKNQEDALNVCNKSRKF